MRLRIEMRCEVDERFPEELSVLRALKRIAAGDVELVDFDGGGWRLVEGEEPIGTVTLLAPALEEVRAG